MYLEPIDVIQIAKCKYQWQKHVEKHYHMFYHMIYITGGKGDIYVEKNKYTISTNEVYFFAPGTEHELIADGEDAMSSIEVKFHVNDSEMIEQLNNLNVKLQSPDEEFKLKLEGLLEEAVMKTEYYKEMINIGATGIMLELLRGTQSKTKIVRMKNFVLNENSKVSNKSTKELKRVLEYINNNYVEEITLKNLSDVANLNPAYLCKQFTKVYNISPIQYVNNLRIEKSKELITYSDLSITEISVAVGFRSIHYFSRYFKKKEKMSPVEYKHYLSECMYISVTEEKGRYEYYFKNDAVNL